MDAQMRTFSTAEKRIRDEEDKEILASSLEFVRFNEDGVKRDVESAIAEASSSSDAGRGQNVVCCIVPPL